MNEKTRQEESRDKKSQETAEEDLDFDLSDLDDEIIDLVDSVEQEDEASENFSFDNSSADEKVSDEAEELSLEDLDLEMELEDSEPDQEVTIDPIEGGQESESRAYDEVEDELEHILSDGKGPGETFEEGQGETTADEDLITDEALAELFASHESEVAQLLQEAGDTTPKDDESTFAAEENIPEDLFSDLAMESEDVAEETAAPEAASVNEEELPEDLFSDLAMESEDIDEGPVADEVTFMVEEEISDEVISEPEPDLEVIAEAPGGEPAEAGEEDVVSDLEKKLDDVVEEAAESALPQAAEEDVVSDVEFEEMIQADLIDKMTPAEAEDLAALVSSQVEEVVTRLVEEKLPSIVERFLRKEIEKIRTSLESQE